MKTTSVLFRSLLSAGLFFSLLFISCNKNNDDGTTVPAAGLMAINLAPSTTASFAISGSSFGSPLPFNSYTGGYISIFPGSRTVDAYTIDGLAARNEGNFESGKYYSLFLVDTGAGLQQLIIKDNFDTLSTTTQSFVRYINAIPESASVTISVNGSPIVNETAPFKKVSDFVAAGAGPITITVSNGSTINVSRTITLESQKVYTVLLSGVPGATGETAVQIKFIVNGTVDGTSARVGANSSVGSN